MKFTIMTVVIFMLNINSSFSEELKNLTPSYLPEQKLGFGTITVGETLPQLKKIRIPELPNDNDIYEDENLIRYRLSFYFRSAGDYCGNEISKSKEYKKYLTVKTKLTQKEMQNKFNQLIPWAKGMVFKEIQSLKDKYQPSNIEYNENFNYISAITGFENEVVSYNLQKKYDYVPDSKSVIYKLKETFGEPSVEPQSSSTGASMVFGDSGLKGYGVTHLINEYNSSSFKKIKGAVTSVQVNRHSNTIEYRSIDAERVYKSFMVFGNQCINDKKAVLLNLIKKEEEHNKKESETFSL